jgi:hypothetical protein
MLPTNVRDYSLALASVGLRRFPDETRTCRTLVIVLPDRRRAEVEIPEQMLDEERSRRHEASLSEAEAYALKNPKAPPPKKEAEKK